MPVYHFSMVVILELCQLMDKVLEISHFPVRSNTLDFDWLWLDLWEEQFKTARACFILNILNQDSKMCITITISYNYKYVQT